MTYRSLLPLALIALPAMASAQITTFVPPAPRQSPARAAVVAEAQAHTDSVRRATITNLTAWVDSAAGVAAVRVDTLPDGTVTTSRTTAAEANKRTVTTFSNGSVAPDTASALPLLALVGLASLSLGTVILAGRKRA